MYKNNRILFLVISIVLACCTFLFLHLQNIDISRDAFIPYLVSGRLEDRIAVVGIITSITIFFLYTVMLLDQFSKRKRDGLSYEFLYTIKYFFSFIFLPFVVIVKTINFVFLTIFHYGRSNAFHVVFPSKTSFFKTLLETFAVIFLIFPLWVVGYFYFSYSTIKIIRNELNLVTDQIRLSGTGSMYPTFPKGSGDSYQDLRKEIVGAPEMKRYPSGFILFGKEFFTYHIGYGDIVSFQNAKTVEITSQDGEEPAGMVKRVVAISGDIIEIRGGILYRNMIALVEPYIARARSTFGGITLHECTQLVVPNGFVFVMGDNRKGSLDSRHELGFVNLSDIAHVIPFSDQKGTLDQAWHDTSKDLEDSSKIKLNRHEYINLLNEERKKIGAKPLVYNTKLENSALLRGSFLLKSGNSLTKDNQGTYTIEQSMKDSGYRNIVWGESPDFGYYEAAELLEKQLAFPDTKAFLETKEFGDIGISEVESPVNDCPTQIIVQHFGGYKPPTYPSDYKESWEKMHKSLKSVQPEWKNLENYQGFYIDHKEDIDRINRIIAYQIEMIESIITTIGKNEWLTDEENTFIDQLDTTNKELNELTSKINSSQ